MAVTPSGAFTFDAVNGVYKVGYDQDGVPGTLNVGALTVNGGTDAVFTATDLDAGEQQWLEIGNAAGTQGTVTVTGFELKIRFGNAGLDDTGSGLLVGRNGGAGTLQLEFGTTFQIYDQSTGAVDRPDFFNEEYVSIGRGVGSTGELTADSATFQILGNAVYMELGVQGGTGNATFAGGSYLHLAASGAGADSEVFLTIGSGTGSVGTLSLDISSVAFVAAPDSYAGFVVGAYGGSGLLELDRSTSFVVNGGAEGAEATVGDGVGGVGRLTIDGGSYMSFQGGSGYDGLVIGRAGGTGSVELTANGIINSVLRADSSGLGGYIVVGQGEGSHGTLSVTDGTVYVGSSGSGDASLEIGRYEGTGIVNLNSGAKVDVTSTNWAYVNIGSGGSGTLNTQDNALVDIAGDDGAYATIGAYGGIGEALVDGGAWQITSASGNAIIDIGHDGIGDETDSGTGTLTLRNGAVIDLAADDNGFSRLRVGGGAGSTAQLEVLGGSTIDMNKPSNDAYAAMVIGFRDATSASVTIDGASSSIKHLDYVGIGFDPLDNGSVSGGHGTLTVTNGARIAVADVMTIGAGGTLSGFNGTLDGNLQLNGGGLVDLRDGQFGNFTINGEVFVDGTGNAVALDIGASDGNALTLDNDQIVVSGPVDGDSDGRLSIVLNALGGFKFAAGETRVVAVTRAGGNAIAPIGEVTGQHADFAFYAGRLAGPHPEEFIFRALNSGATGGLGILDFGVAAPAAVLNYDATLNSGLAKGGLLGNVGGRAHNVDQFLGTDLGDSLHIAGTATRAFTLDGRGGADNLLGGFGADMLLGGAGGDTLNGNRSGDLMRGGADNDIYVVDNALDTVDELNAGGTGTADLVQSSIGFSLVNSARLLGEVERLTLTGTGRVNGTGNALNNVITGNAATNILNGGAGGDVMRGGGDTDFYVVDNALDIVDERSAGGTGTADLVQSSISFSLANSARVFGAVERLTLTGTGRINGIGNALNNLIVGNAATNILDGGIGLDTLNGGAGNDILRGGLGNDTLTGGQHSDLFTFNTALNASANRDVITDFSHVSDSIQLENAIFTRLGAAGPLKAGFFHIGPAAADADDFIVYNQANGWLSYDSNGNGAGGAVLFAVLSTRPTILFNDFVVI